MIRGKGKSLISTFCIFTGDVFWKTSFEVIVL